MIPSISELSSSRNMHEILSISTHLIITRRENLITVAADSFPNEEIPVRLVLTRIAATQIKNNVKY